MLGGFLVPFRSQFKALPISGPPTPSLPTTIRGVCVSNVLARDLLIDLDPPRARSGCAFTRVDGGAFAAAAAEGLLLWVRIYHRSTLSLGFTSLHLAIIFFFCTDKAVQLSIGHRSCGRIVCRRAFVVSQTNWTTAAVVRQVMHYCCT